MMSRLIIILAVLITSINMSGCAINVIKSCGDVENSEVFKRSIKK